MHGSFLSSIIQRAIADDREALAILYQRYSARMYRVDCHITASHDDARDALHDIFVGLPELLRKYSGHGDLEGWLLRVVARRALMVVRRRNRFPEFSWDELIIHPFVDVDIPTLNRVTLERAISRLPDSLRIIFWLKEVEGFTHEEIAALLETTISATTNKLYRARRQLQNLLRTENDA